MDNMILGLLLLDSRTIYQLRDRIGKGLALMYSSSMGSIQAALKKLLERGHIRYVETMEGGKYKKVYSITESGKQHFLVWINAPISEQGIRCPELVKVYFLGFAEEENREASLQNYLSLLWERQHALATICAEAERQEIPEESREIFRYQRLSAQYGKALYEFNIRWFENALERMKRGEL